MYITSGEVGDFKKSYQNWKCKWQNSFNPTLGKIIKLEDRV